jgi:hypothetical protein
MLQDERLIEKTRSKKKYLDSFIDTVSIKVIPKIEDCQRGRGFEAIFP